MRRAAAAAACFVAATATVGAQQAAAPPFEVHQVEIGAGPWFVFADLDPTSGTMRHFVADISGAGEVRPLLHTPTGYRIEQWLDERHLLVTGLVHAMERLFVVDARTGSQRALGVETWYHHVQDRRIVFQEARRLGTVRWDAPAEPVRLIDRTFRGLQVRGGFAFGVDDERLWRIDLTTGETRPIGSARITDATGVSVSPGGTLLSISRWSQRPAIECRGPRAGEREPLHTGWGMVRFADVGVFDLAAAEPRWHHTTARVGRYSEPDLPPPPAGTWLDDRQIVLHRLVADAGGDRLLPIAHDVLAATERELPPAAGTGAADEPIDGEHHYRVPSPDGRWLAVFTGHPERLSFDDEPTTGGDVELVHVSTGARRRLAHTDVVSWQWLRAR